ncbi:MAG TPA: hypothetical protein VG273_11795 [Bryobacteraceae bacterium]|jgi:hypothetical protein|nr:hypothetical protein [Bryobacteraceae bacterium]
MVLSRYGTEQETFSDQRLRNQAAAWSTPTLNMTTGQWSEGREGGLNLQTQVARWPSPNANPSAPNNSKTRENGRISERLTDQCLESRAMAFSSLLDRKIQSGATCWCGTTSCGLPSHKRRLNPIFVNWLMGWPAFWTAPEPIPFAPRAMESYRSRLQSHFQFLLTELRLLNV